MSQHHLQLHFHQLMMSWFLLLLHLWEFHLHCHPLAYHLLHRSLVLHLLLHLLALEDQYLPHLHPRPWQHTYLHQVTIIIIVYIVLLIG